MNDLLDKAFFSNFDLDVTKAALEEAKESLAAHDGLAEQFEAIFLPMDEKKVESMRNIIQPMKLARIANKQRDSAQGN